MGRIIPDIMENKIHVPNHQPVYVDKWVNCSPSCYTYNHQHLHGTILQVDPPNMCTLILRRNCWNCCLGELTLWE